MNMEVELARAIFNAETSYKEAQKKVDEIKAHRAMLYERLKAHLDDAGKVSTGHIDGVGEIAYKEKIYNSVTKANMDSFVGFLKANGMGGIVKQTVEANTLKSFCSELLNRIVDKVDSLKDRDLPDEARNDLFRTFIDESFSGVKAPHIANWLDSSSLEIAKKCLESVHVSSFVDVKPSFTKRGKIA